MRQKFITLLGNPVRITVLCNLQTGAKNVQELTKLCELSQSALSQHLGKLRAGGIVRVQRLGKYRYYTLSDPRYGQLAILLREFDSKNE